MKVGATYRQIKRRKSPPLSSAMASEVIRAPDGLYGVAVAETGISKSSPDGTLTYRGYRIEDLYENASFNECAYLILNGKLPTRKELEAFSTGLRAQAKVQPNVYEVVRNIPRGAHPIDVLRTAVSALGATEMSLSPQMQQYSLVAKMPALVANCYRISRGMDVIEPDEGLDSAGNLLYMLRGARPDPFESWVLERELILYLEHDLNASTFTVRVVASTLADVYSSCTAGLAALKGPLHGGANEAAMAMILAVGSPDAARPYVESAFKEGKKVMGFGHRVYKKVDPRAQLSKSMLKRVLEAKQMDSTMYETSDALEKAMWLTKRIPPNLDFYAAPIFYALSIPIEVYTPIFAASRVVGWISHYNEQVARNKLFRPDAVYSGPSDLQYVPIDKR